MLSRPSGAGPFPAILLLHGSHGFSREYAQLAEALAGKGIVAVAACWFTGGGGIGARFITPIACPEAPTMSAASSNQTFQTVDALAHAVRTLPGVQAGPIALFGHSRGAGAALNYVLRTGSAGALALNSAGYPAELADRVAGIETPILILHGTEDGPTDGGSAVTEVKMAQAFEAALRRAGKDVEAAYYARGHNGIFQDATQRDDEVRRIAAFVRSHLSGHSSSSRDVSSSKAER